MHESLPKEKLPVRSALGNIDIFTLDSEHIDLHGLRHIAAELSPTQIPTSPLEAQVRAQSWNDEPETDISPANIIDEYRRLSSIPGILEAHPNWTSRIKRIQAANYSYPILIYKGVVIDGLHRILHAIVYGREMILAHAFETLPPEAYAADNLLEHFN